MTLSVYKRTVVWVRSHYANNASDFQSQRRVLRERADVYGIDNFECYLSRGYTVSDKKEKRVIMKQ